MIPLQAPFGSVVAAIVFGLVPIVVLVIVIYRLAQIAENTARMADALEAIAFDRRRED